MKVYRRGNAAAIELGPRQFLAEGGQGKVFVRGQTAFKIYHDPAQLPALDKLLCLGALRDPRVLRPQDILIDERGTPVGFTTRFLADTWPLGRLIPRAFKQREGVTPAHVEHLITRLRGGIEAVHAEGCLLVDINELNFLIPKDFSEVFFIDVDAWQTARHPAAALLDAVRDWTVPTGAWTRDTDWFSFGVVTFQLLTGVHPFKGRYGGSEPGFRERLPTDAPDDAFAVTRRRMQAGLSVFHPEVQVPPTTEPFGALPPTWLTWYRDLFAAGHRGPPPVDFQAPAPVVPVASVAAAGGLVLTPLDTLAGRLLRLFAGALHRVAVTDQGVWLDGQRLPFSPEVAHHCAFSPKAGRPVGLDTRTPVPVLTDLLARAPIAFGLAADAVASQGGQVWLKTGDQVHALVLTEVGGQLIAGTRPVAQVMPHAARLFPGVVVQSLLGATYVHLLEADRARQIRLPALEGHKVLDARFDQGVLMVVTHAGNTCDLHVFRFDGDASASEKEREPGRLPRLSAADAVPAPSLCRSAATAHADGFDHQVTPDAAPAVPAFVVRGGLCIQLTETGTLALWPTARGAPARREVADPALTEAPLLACDAAGLLLGRAGAVVRARTS